ncbi:MAG: hypothetical protein RML45_12175 [Acetobacteraceae bacterium]|nr:hypothetical protein [Acetobacteraceae bacterium]
MAAFGHRDQDIEAWFGVVRWPVAQLPAERPPPAFKRLSVHHRCRGGSLAFALPKEAEQARAPI